MTARRQSPQASGAATLQSDPNGDVVRANRRLKLLLLGLISGNFATSFGRVYSRGPLSPCFDSTKEAKSAGL